MKAGQGVIVLMVCLLGACTYWPPKGEGGQAESFQTAPAYTHSLRQMNKTRLECYDRMLQGLSTSWLRQTHPARLMRLSLIWTQSTRAHAAHLNEEAQDRLITLDEETNAFLKTLDQSSLFRPLSTPSLQKETCS